MAAPNLTAAVGLLVGARLIANAGSLLNLAKKSASAIQFLGADVSKQSVIYLAQLVQEAPTNLKGKMARKLACIASLASRVDAFGESPTGEYGRQLRAKLENQYSTAAVSTLPTKRKNEESEVAAQKRPKIGEVEAASPAVVEEPTPKKDKKKKKKEAAEVKEEVVEAAEPAPAPAPAEKKKKKKKKKNKE